MRTLFNKAIRYCAVGVALCAMLTPAAATAQIDLGRLIQGAAKGVQALAISDDQVAAYVHQYVTKMDAQNKVLSGDNPYAVRLSRLTQGLDEVDGIPLNFKVYQNPQVNAFACADGSVRVYTGLMDCMDDNEVLGVIGHEIGHVAHHDSKKQFKQALLNSALRDGLAGASAKIGVLTDSQLGDLAEALSESHYSQKQESNADDYGYDFLRSHGKNPVAMVESFEKIQQIENASGQANGSPVNQLFSSHPQTAERIQHLEQRAIKDGYMDRNGNIINGNAANRTLTTMPATPTAPTGKAVKSQTPAGTSRQTPVINRNNVPSIRLEDLSKYNL